MQSKIEITKEKENFKTPVLMQNYKDENFIVLANKMDLDDTIFSGMIISKGNYPSNSGYYSNSWSIDCFIKLSSDVKVTLFND